jgi:hypothetical protein
MTRRVSSDLSDARLLLEQLRIAAASDGASPKSFALLLRRVSETKAWLEEFRSFKAYLVAPEPEGLGMNETVFLHIAELGGEAKLARKLLYGEVPEAARRPGMNKGTTPIAPQSKTVEQEIRRLKRDDPELAERVISGEVSAYAAARQKGWRRPRIVLSTPDRIARSLSNHLSADDMALLIVYLIREHEGVPAREES